MNYDRILEEALRLLVDELENGAIAFDNEADLRAHIFHLCKNLMQQSNPKFPLPIHAEIKIIKGHAKKVDLSFGPNAETVVELKFEPWKSEEGNVFILEKNSKNSIETDLKKLKKYAELGKSAHFVMFETERPDDDFYHPEETVIAGIPEDDWEIRRGFCWVHFKI